MGGALEARGIPAGEGRLYSETIGEIESEGKVLVIKRLFVTYHLKLTRDKRPVAERAHEIHADYCPVARTIRGCVDIHTELVMEDLPFEE